MNEKLSGGLPKTISDNRIQSLTLDEPINVSKSLRPIKGGGLQLTRCGNCSNKPTGM